MSAQRPADHDIRVTALDPAHSFIVEAPAGSGKTALLTQRFLRLLAHVQSPEEILAITFTRKAAAEMRTRVLQALALAESAVPPASSLAAENWRLARAAKLNDEQHDWQLAAHPARLRIMTIDALNNYLARQLPILSGVGAALRISTDTTSLYAEVALRLVERLAHRDVQSVAVEKLLRHLDNQYDAFTRLLSAELARREYWLDLGVPHLDPDTLRARLESSLKIVIENNLRELRAAIPVSTHSQIAQLACYGAANLLSMNAASVITACHELADLPLASSDALAQWRGVAELLLTKEGTWRVQVDKRLGFPADDKTRKQMLKELIATLQEDSSLAAQLHNVRNLPDAHYSDSQWEALAALLQVLKLAIGELEVVMRERGEADYVANAIAARRALGSTTEPTDLALRLDYRLQHLLVDEFQDTSLGQVELLSLLTAGWSEDDGRTLFCVGDPMQSIYRFRHADVSLFLALKQHGLNQLRLTPLRLGVNFRASTSLLGWVNETFASVLPQHDDADRGAVAYTPSAARPDAATEGGVFVHPIVVENADGRALEAKQICDLIQQQLAASRDSKIAVLTPNRSHLQWIIAELKKRGISYQAVDIDPLAQRPAVQDLIALTRALVHFADRTAWLSILRAPWCGLSLADLHALATDNHEMTLWEAMRDVDRISQLSSEGQQRLACFSHILSLSLALRGRIALRDCVERTWHALGGPACVESVAALADCQAYLDHLQSIERNGDLEDIAQLETQLTQLYATSNSALSRVELMTIHRAKGLEFDIVILPALDRGGRGDQSTLLRSQVLPISDHERALLLAPIAASGAEQDAIYRWMAALDKERARCEQSRLLYVAATRAERELHLFGVLEKQDEKVSAPKSGTFLRLLWPVVEAAFVAAVTAEHAADDLVADEYIALEGVCTRRLPLSWEMPLPLLNVEGHSVVDTLQNDPLRPEFAWVGETARHVGTLVHREIERLAVEGIAERTLDEIANNGSHYLVQLAELGVPEAMRAAAADRAIAALLSLLNDTRGRWILAGTELHREAASEFALSGVIGAEIVNGIIDRTLIDSEGTRWIIDFKTSSHEGGGLEEFLVNETERYRPQLNRYAHLMRGYDDLHPLKAALYFPLLHAWCEVAIDS